MRWLPLESNPEVMNKFIVDLGAQGPYIFHDIYGLESDLLAMLPRPVAAVLLLFPITEKYEDARIEEDKALEEKGQTVSDNVFFVKQTIGNACGTMGLIHAICNNRDKIELGGFFKEFFESSSALTPDTRATKLEESETLSTVHNDLALEGQSAAPDINEEVTLHFICFVEKDGSLYELDGRRPFPVNRGASSQETMLEDTAKVVQSFIDRDPANIQFSLVALVKQPEEEA